MLLLHINQRLYQYYFHSVFSFSLSERKYFWAIWDPNSLNAFRLSDVSTDSPGWKSNHENLQHWKKLRTFWCYRVPEIPSLSFLQLGKKKSDILNIRIFSSNFSTLLLQTYLVSLRLDIFYKLMVPGFLLSILSFKLLFYSKVQQNIANREDGKMLKSWSFLPRILLSSEEHDI